MNIGTLQINSGTAASSLTKAVTPSGSNRRLLIFAGSRDTTAADQVVDSLTTGGNACTKIGSVGATLNMRMEAWEYIAPTASAQDVVATYHGTVDKALLVIIPLDDASQSAGADATGSDSGFDTTVSSAVTTVADNCIVFDCVFSKIDFSLTGKAGAGQTELATGAVSVDSYGVSYEGPKTPAGSVTMSWDNSEDSGDDFAHFAVSIAPFVAATSVKDLIGIGMIAFPR